MVYCVYSLESLQRGDSNENTPYTHILKKIEKYPYFASWHGAMIDTNQLELSLSRSCFHGP